MKIILLERIVKLGQMGDTVNVKDGYARNFLLPQGKALRANKANLAVFESQRADLEARNLERKSDAEQVHEKLDGTTYIIIRSAGETGQLYGSVTTRDIAETLVEGGFKVARNQVSLMAPIKVIGIHDLTIALHPEVDTVVSVNVARSQDEAELQASGKDLTQREVFEMEPLPDEDEDEGDLSEIFEDGVEMESEDEDDAQDEAASVEAVEASDEDEVK